MPKLGEALQDAWTDARRCKTPDHAPLTVDAGAYELENVLHGDHVFLHATHLADLHHLAGPVAQPFEMHDHVDRAGDLRTDCPQRQVIDRKSTRLNSSHLGISYAVFCLK